MARTEKLTPNAFNAVVGIVLNGTFNCTQIFAKDGSRRNSAQRLNIVTSYAAAIAVPLSSCRPHVRRRACLP